jgi:hypothetical protein
MYAPVTSLFYICAVSLVKAAVNKHAEKDSELGIRHALQGMVYIARVLEKNF